MQFDLHGDGWTHEVMNELVDMLHDYIDAFSKSPMDLGECDLLRFNMTVPAGSPPV